jgi:hypothetical protein
LAEHKPWWPPSRTLLWVLCGLAVLGHVVALYTPGDPNSVSVPGLDKVVHLLLFAVPVWLLASLTSRVWVVAAVFTGEAFLSEVVQARFLPDRSGDPIDALFDLFGIAVAVLLVQRKRGA